METGSSVLSREHEEPCGLPEILRRSVLWAGEDGLNKSMELCGPPSLAGG